MPTSFVFVYQTPLKNQTIQKIRNPPCEDFEIHDKDLPAMSVLGLLLVRLHIRLSKVFFFENFLKIFQNWYFTC